MVYGVRNGMEWHGTKHKAKRKKSQQIAYLFDEMVLQFFQVTRKSSDFYTKFMMFPIGERMIQVMFLLLDMVVVMVLVR